MKRKTPQEPPPDLQLLLFPGITTGELVEQLQKYPPTTRAFIGWPGKDDKTVSRDVYGLVPHVTEFMKQSMPDSVTLLCHRTKKAWRQWLREQAEQQKQFSRGKRPSKVNPTLNND